MLCVVMVLVIFCAEVKEYSWQSVGINGGSL